MRLVAALSITVMAAAFYFAPCDGNGFWSWFKLGGGIVCPGVFTPR